MTVFKIFDRDNNGRLDASELKAVMSAVINAEVTDEEVEAMIREADLNGDGVLDPGEFIKIMRQHR